MQRQTSIWNPQEQDTIQHIYVQVKQQLLQLFFATVFVLFRGGDPEHGGNSSFKTDNCSPAVMGGDGEGEAQLSAPCELC